METYKCDKCGMTINATCGKCDAPLVNDVLKLDDGREVQISKCPNGHGKIKSPLCCGEDMSCAIQGIIKFQDKQISKKIININGYQNMLLFIKKQHEQFPLFKQSIK